ncbi:MAG: serine hydrolase, partial [Myxococcota bacterium]
AGHMSLGQNHLFDEWEGTPRSEVTLEQMLQMAPGLEWSEEYTNPFDDTIQMLFGADEAARGALEKPLAYPPGSHWNYSSGTSNMLSLLLRRALAEEGEDYLGYPQRALFSPLGMKTSVLEPDATGTFVASSFGFASALDWARFGQLYLDDGLVLGERVLPAGWLEQACTPTPESGGQYGGHFWLRVGEDALTRPSPLPDDACHAAGHEGQFVTIVPSERTVIVRLGLTPDRSAWHQEDFAKSVLDALSADRG